jgi:putative SOS response-associated peptidase YedK
MAGRFALTATPHEVEAMFGTGDVEDFPPRYNIAPTQPILLVTAGFPRDPGSNRPDRRSLLVRWGFVPGWATDPRRVSLLFNARAETAAHKNAFRAAMRHRRSLVPASGFYEWQSGAEPRQAYWVRPRRGGLIAFGALMETWLEPGGSEIDTAALLTTEANGALASIRDRMPVVIEPGDFARWLDCRNYEPRDVIDLTRALDPDFFEAIPVSDKVNKVANVGPDLQVPLAASPLRPKPSGSGQLTLL